MYVACSLTGIEYGSFNCQSPEDECISNADCAKVGFGDPVCIQTDDHRQCASVVCGRPFLVRAEPRVSALVARRDWFTEAGESPRLDHLSAAERIDLAAHWARMGQMEHASIAAFARFSLQLLSLGAPSELIEACTSALADETAHAKLCFRLASAYAGRALGPGPLDVADSLGATTLDEVVDLVIAEGCFGETRAALEALEAAELAADPVIRAAYTRIAGDEQRHAELAFRFVRWALERDPHAVRQRVLQARGQASASDTASRQVVLPCLDALLAA
jgi:hypothetical protein